MVSVCERGNEERRIAELWTAQVCGVARRRTWFRLVLGAPLRLDAPVSRPFRGWRSWPWTLLVALGHQLSALGDQRLELVHVLGQQVVRGEQREAGIHLCPVL